MNSPTLLELVLYVGQGITALFSIWGMIVQTTQGLKLLKVLNEYESMIETTLNKRKVKVA